MSRKQVIWRWTKRCLKWGGLSLFALIAVVVGINCYDPPISAESLAYLARPVNQVPDEENLYLAFEGFDAPEGQSLTTFGRARQEFDDLLAQRSMAGDFDEVASKRPAGIPRRTVAGCRGGPELWTNASKVMQNDRPSDADRRFDQRYLSLLQYTRYADVHADSLASMASYPPSAARCMFLAGVITGLQSMDQRRQQQSTHLLLLDMRMLRIVLDNSDDFFAKRIAARALIYDWCYFANALASQPQVLDAVRGETGDLDLWTGPAAWDVTSSYLRAARQMQNFLASLPDATSKGVPRSYWVAAHFLKKRATTNLFVEGLSRLSTAAAGDPHVMRPHIEEQTRWISEQGFGWNPRSLYNPLGRQLIFGASLMADTSFFFQDCVAYERLLHLSYAIHDQNIAAAQVPEFMAQHPEWSVHPASGVPFVFEASSSSISFVPVVQEHQQIPSSLKLWAAPTPLP